MTPQRGLMFPPVNSEKAQNAIIRGGACQQVVASKEVGCQGIFAWACLWVLIEGKIRVMHCGIPCIDRRKIVLGKL